MQDARSLAVAWYYKEHFGFSKAPPASDPEVVRNMARALMAVAGADGDLTGVERTWVFGYLAAKGYPEEVLAELMRDSVEHPAKVSELMELGILAKSGRILIYDAVRAASANGYSANEHKAVRVVASALGISEGDVAKIEALVQDELELKKRRIATLMPGGHPNL